MARESVSLKVWQRWVVAGACLLGLPNIAPAVASVAPVQSPSLAFAGEQVVGFSQEQGELSFDFKRADVHDVLRILAEAGNFSLVVDDDVAGLLTLRYQARDWADALAAVAQAAGLEIERNGASIRVATRAVRLAEYEEARRLREAREQAEPLVFRIVPVRNADAAVLAALLNGGDLARSGRPSALSERGFVFVEASANALFIADVADRLERIETLIAELDRLPAQVVIESEVVEASTDTSQALGIQWGYRGAFGERAQPEPRSGPDLEVGGPASGEGLGDVPWIAAFPAALDATAGSAVSIGWGALDGPQAVALRLSALEREGKARVISRPRVVTLNNVPATIKSLTVIRVKLPSTDTLVRTDGGGTLAPSTATEKIETGIVLVVTPRITADDRVVLDLFIKSSQADFSRQVDGIPTETSREATSRVVVGNGQTVVLGGIYATVDERRSSGVPYLRSLPGIGWFFRGNEKAQRREDLLVFITPRILATLPPVVPEANEG